MPSERTTQGPRVVAEFLDAHPHQLETYVGSHLASPLTVTGLLDVTGYAHDTGSQVTGQVAIPGFGAYPGGRADRTDPPALRPRELRRELGAGRPRAGPELPVASRSPPRPAELVPSGSAVDRSVARLERPRVRRRRARHGCAPVGGRRPRCAAIAGARTTRRVLRPHRRGGVVGAVGTLLASAFLAELDGSWARLRHCSNPECESVFYDRSKNRSGRWCSMRSCGNQAKVRAYRERHRTPGR